MAVAIESLRRTEVFPLRIVSLVLVPSEQAAHHARQLCSGGLLVEVESVAAMDSSPSGTVYLAYLDRAHVADHVRALVNWCASVAPPPAVIVLIEGGTTIVDREEALAAGCDDVADARISHRELGSRIRAVHRRLGWSENQQLLRFGTLTLDLEQRQLWEGGQRSQLTEFETALLRELIACGGRALSYDEIFRAVWQKAITREAPRQIQTIVKRLRRKFTRPDMIETVRDIGLRLAEP